MTEEEKIAQERKLARVKELEEKILDRRESEVEAEEYFRLKGELRREKEAKAEV